MKWRNERIRFYWAWIHKGSRAIDPDSLSNSRAQVSQYYQGVPGKVVKVALQVVV